MKFLNSVAKLLPLIALCALTFIGCKKTDELLTPIKPPLEIPPTANDGVKVAATVTGSVIDENNKPVANAVVTAGTATTTTDAMGNFSFRNIVISVLNGSVTVTKAGYFTGIRNFVTEERKNNYVKIQLIKQVLSGTVASASGGVITTSTATITFPANAFVTASGAPYSGNVKVYATWIDPTAANLPLVVPGDLRGLTATNGEYLLKSYGMVGAELKDDNGNTLKIATGKTASISFPIPAPLQTTAPETIPLWHFDEVTNRWREEGSATKNGNNYVGQVNKFSFWNVDVPANFVYLDMRLINSANNLPLVNTMVKITSLATNTSAYDHTNDSGYVGGFVPKGESLKLEVIAGTACNTNTVIYTQNIGPYTSNTNLGNVNVTLPANNVINFTGVVNGCNNMPVSNGYISLSLANGTSTIAYTNTSGVVNFSMVHCGGSTAYSYNAVDLANGNYSNTVTGNATSSNVNLGTVAACGNTINLSGVYIAGSIDRRAVVWKDGIPTFLTAVPTGNKYAHAGMVLVNNNDVYVLGFEEDSTIANGNTSIIKLWKNGVVTNITSGNTYAYPSGLDVYNGNVYIVGDEGVFNTSFDNKVWVNGVPTILTKGSFDDTETNGIKVSNGDVYVSGQGNNFISFGIQKPIYWKNGIINILPSISQQAFTTNLFVNGSDLYFSGSDSINAVYWKNGIKTVLPIQANSISAINYSVFVDNNTIYNAGSMNYTNGGGTSYHNANYWVNNSINMLTNNSTHGVYPEIYGIFVKNNIVYSAGNYDGNSGGNGSYLYFQNNVPVQLSLAGGQDVYLGGIFVQ